MIVLTSNQCTGARSRATSLLSPDLLRTPEKFARFVDLIRSLNQLVGECIFWADAGSSYSGKTIGRADLNGKHVNQKFIKGTNGGFGIAVTGGNP